MSENEIETLFEQVVEHEKAFTKLFSSLDQRVSKDSVALTTPLNFRHILAVNHFRLSELNTGLLRLVSDRLAIPCRIIARSMYEMILVHAYLASLNEETRTEAVICYYVQSYNEELKKHRDEENHPEIDLELNLPDSRSELLEQKIELCRLISISQDPEKEIDDRVSKKYGNFKPYQLAKELAREERGKLKNYLLIYFSFYRNASDQAHGNLIGSRSNIDSTGTKLGVSDYYWCTYTSIHTALLALNLIHIHLDIVGEFFEVKELRNSTRTLHRRSQSLLEALSLFPRN